MQFYKHPFFYVGTTVVAVATLVACSAIPVKNNPPATTGESNKIIPPVQTQPQQPQPPQGRVVANPTPTPQQPQPTPMPSPTPAPTYHYGSFSEWKQDFLNRSTAQGYSGQSLNGFIGRADLNNQVISLDSKQAEFTKMIWEYVEGSASSNRVAQGKRQINDYPTLLGQIEQTYRVPREIVVAIWGIESSYGAGTGNTDLIDALSSLAYDGRRRAFAERELLALMNLVERGDVSRHELKGSWAGGMGHTQFIPSTWQKFGVDGNNDGRKNPWTVSDALSSTANYLSKSGWLYGVDAFYEVYLPSNFNHQLIGQKMPLANWQSQGIQINGYANPQAVAELWLPAGIQGPALLITQNFDVIKVYNNSSSYALGVALLAKRLGGQSGINASWPRHERGLSSAQIQRLQQNLTAMGFDTGGVDGVAGANTRRAFARWQASQGRVPDGFISQNSANALIW